MFILTIKIFDSTFKGKKCEDVLKTLIPSITDFTQICINPLLNTANQTNIFTWIDGIYNNNQNLQINSGFTVLQMLAIRDPSSPFYILINDKINSLKITYSLVGNNLALNLLPLGLRQWFDASITKNFDIPSYQANSIIDWSPELFQSKFLLLL